MIKDKERVKKHGEVFTPKQTVKKILETRISAKDFGSKKSFVDPACGNGNFLVEIISYKIKNGLTPWEALSTTFGVDIMQDNVIECRERLLETAGVKQKRFKKLVETTVVCGDFLKQSADELFKDYIDNYKKDA